MDNDLSILQWISTSKPFTKSRINLKTVTSLSELPILTVGKQINKNSRLYLVINHGRGQEMILQFDSEMEKHQWWCGLQYFVLLAVAEQNQGYLLFPSFNH